MNSKCREANYNHCETVLILANIFVVQVVSSEFLKWANSGTYAWKLILFIFNSTVMEKQTDV